LVAHGGFKSELIGVLLEQRNHLQRIFDWYAGVDSKQLLIGSVHACKRCSA
jgi:hypothetical protein